MNKNYSEIRKNRKRKNSLRTIATDQETKTDSLPIVNLCI